MAKKKQESEIVEIEGKENSENPTQVKEKTPTKAELVKAEADAVDFSQEVYYGDGPWPKLSRAAAVLLGFSRYYLGVPCVNGHDMPRKTKTSACLGCSHAKLRERHKRRLKDDVEYKAKFAAKAKARRLRKSAEKKSAQDAMRENAAPAE